MVGMKRTLKRLANTIQTFEVLLEELAEGIVNDLMDDLKETVKEEGKKVYGTNRSRLRVRKVPKAKNTGD